MFELGHAMGSKQGRGRGRLAKSGSWIVQRLVKSAMLMHSSILYQALYPTVTALHLHFHLLVIPTAVHGHDTASLLLKSPMHLILGVKAALDSVKGTSRVVQAVPLKRRSNVTRRLNADQWKAFG